MSKATQEAKDMIKTSVGTEENKTETPAIEVIPAITLEELESVALPGEFRESDIGNEQTEEPQSWCIADDSCADWAVRKIAEEKAELDRITELGEAEIDRIKGKIEAAQKRYESNTSFLTGKLAEYFQTVKHKKTKTQESYRLLSGTLKLKLGKATMKHDTDKLIEFLKKSGNKDFIKTTEKPAWGDYKKRLSIVAGQVVDNETGELVEGVNVIEKPDVFTVDVK